MITETQLLKARKCAQAAGFFNVNKTITKMLAVKIIGKV